MKKVLGLLVAVAAMAVPSVAFAGEEGGGGTRVCQGGSECEIDQEQTVGRGGTGIQQGGIAGRDVNNTATVNNVRRGNTFIRGHGGGDFDHDNGVVHDNGVSHGVGGGNVTSFGHGGGDVGHGVGGGVGGVTLARTGSDAWILALVGGVALAGGLGLLAAQRRGRLSA